MTSVADYVGEWAAGHRREIEAAGTSVGRFRTSAHTRAIEAIFRDRRVAVTAQQQLSSELATTVWPLVAAECVAWLTVVERGAQLKALFVERTDPLVGADAERAQLRQKFVDNRISDRRRNPRGVEENVAELVAEFERAIARTAGDPLAQLSRIRAQSDRSAEWAAARQIWCTAAGFVADDGDLDDLIRPAAEVLLGAVERSPAGRQASLAEQVTAAAARIDCPFGIMDPAKRRFMMVGWLLVHAESTADSVTAAADSAVEVDREDSRQRVAWACRRYTDGTHDMVGGMDLLRVAAATPGVAAVPDHAHGWPEAALDGVGIDESIRGVVGEAVPLHDRTWQQRPWNGPAVVLRRHLAEENIATGEHPAFIRECQRDMVIRFRQQLIRSELDGPAADFPTVLAVHGMIKVIGQRAWLTMIKKQVEASVQQTRYWVAASSAGSHAPDPADAVLEDPGSADELGDGWAVLLSRILPMDRIPEHVQADPRAIHHARRFLAQVRGRGAVRAHWGLPAGADLDFDEALRCSVQQAWAPGSVGERQRQRREREVRQTRALLIKMVRAQLEVGAGR
ncbi:hypothetical protein [Skermania piniformis]|uniref:Uncharacterized protein n=1 Tax=Skermania pinensis TaxID=39122 RepID=A0ABX8SDU5_9ACTN|nr:hypothetical protein [Skermania piniformis]QXQ15327.1 hypothetical protein KV203_08460 [Skermania piniformis]